MANNNDQELKGNGYPYDNFYDNEEASINTDKTMAFINVPLESDKDKILRTVYHDLFLAQRKQSFISKVTDKALSEGKTSIAGKLLDPLYGDAKEETIEIYSRLFRKFIGLYYYDINGNPSNLVGFTSIPAIASGDSTVIISGAHIPQLNALKENETNKLNFVFGIFDVLIEQAENEILAMTEGVNSIKVEFQTPIPRVGDLWQVLEKRGYEVENSHDMPNGIIRFTKTLTRKKTDMYERNSSR